MNANGNIPTINLNQDGVSEHWTVADDIIPATVDDADGSTSNYVFELYGTVERTIT